MKRLSNSVVILLMIITLIGAGLGVLAVRISEDVSTVSAYNAYVDSARQRAEKGINYYAKADYLNAFAIYNEDQELFQEFLNFLDTTGDSSYRTYLNIYISLYPQDVMGYERLCEIYYDEENFKKVQTTLASAKQANVTSERLKEYQEKTDYVFSAVARGYSNISEIYGRQAIVEKGDLKGLYYFGSGVILPVEYEQISYYINGTIAVKKDGECYFTDIVGNKSGVASKEIDSLSMLSNGLAAVSVNGAYSYVSTSLVVPENLPYQYASAFSENIAAVKVNDKWGIIDSSAQYVIEPQYEDILLTEFGTCISCGVIFAKQSDGWIMLDATGSRMNEYVFSEVEHFRLSGQPAAVLLNNKWTFVKTSGELFEVEQEVFAAKSYDAYLAPVTLDGELWGYMDAYGKIVIEPQFMDCKQFSEYGIAPVKEGESWSIIQLIKYQ